MKKLFILFLLLPTFAFSFDTTVRGFLALDTLNFEKIESKKGAAVIGIGVLDLKIFAEQDNMTAAMKLDLDGKLGDQNNIFEEAYASYRGIKNLKLSLGKGVIRFQNLHWGVVENSFLDGGSILGSENSWRKVSRKAFVSASYGHRSLGYLNTFSLFGDTSEIKYNEKGYVRYSMSSSKVTGYETEAVNAFNSEKQLGLSNRIEFFKFDPWTVLLSAIYFKNKQQYRPSYGLDLGLNRESDDYEIWIDLMYGFTSKAPYEAYSTYKKNEYFLQTGIQYYINENWSFLSNFEYTYVNDLAHTYPSSFTQDGTTYTPDSKYFLDKSAQKITSNQYKFEIGGQYKLSKSSFLTIGALYENKKVKKNDIPDLSTISNVQNPNLSAYKLATTVSFWF